MAFNLLVLCCLGYAGFLFLIAFAAERPGAESRQPWLKSATVYTLSLSVYCTAWTFYGAVGFAARSGLEFLTIYTGPTLVFVGWWWILRKLVRIAKTHHITSIADLISSRYGKSPLLGVVVTLLCLIAATPYVALQLQSVALSFSVFAQDGPRPDQNTIALWVAGGLALFTILFGTRSLNAHEQHHGVITAIAFEAVVKLLALIAVGAFVVWGLADGPRDIFAKIEASPLAHLPLQPSRWTALTFLSAAAILTLPRMFQVLVVENADERHLITASWAFPLYLAAMSLFVIPIAVVGLEILPQGANPDLFVLLLPLSQDQDGLALLAFLGGFSSATSMVVICAIALATMVSNHIIMPILLRFGRTRGTEPGDLKRGLLLARRLSIVGVMGCGYIYYLLSGGSGALADIGLIAFVGVAQLLPAMMGALFWQGATKAGAFGGILTGFTLWLYTLYLPSLGPDGAMSLSTLTYGPYGQSWAIPQALFGMQGLDPLVHALLWSLALNTLVFCALSLLTQASALEHLQASQFIDVFHTGPAHPWHRSQAEAEDLLRMTQRILGEEEGLHFFATEARAQGQDGPLPPITPAFLSHLEQRLAGAIGAATAHAMLIQITGGSATLRVEDLLAAANETAEAKAYSHRLETQQIELSRTAAQLSAANQKLTQISVQKDAFLSQISHELRTPMTSIRAFSDILRTADLPKPEATRYAEIVHQESGRLTRLLDDLLDLSVLESGQVSLNLQPFLLSQLIERAQVMADLSGGLTLLRDPATEQIEVCSDPDRLVQVFLNLISNAAKYCDASQPVLQIQVRPLQERLQIDFIDNGRGIPPHQQTLIFEKFARLTDSTHAGGAGLGLAICREIMATLGGTITYLPAKGGTGFRISLPKTPPPASIQ